MHTAQGMWGVRKAFFISSISAASVAVTALACRIHTTTTSPRFCFTAPPPSFSLPHLCDLRNTRTTALRLGFDFTAAAQPYSSSFLSRSGSTIATKRHMAASSSTTISPATVKTKVLTLLFVRRANPTSGVKEVLLGMKKRGFGIGKWNGFGGKVEPGETIEAAALRELEEESCVKASGVELRGKITFTFLTIPEVLKVSVFEAVGPMTGEPQETEEMKPQWYAESDIPFEKMWADDKYWVPLFLEGKRFRALFEFDDESTIVRYDLDTLKEGEEL